MLSYNNKNVVLHELIGLKVRVMHSSDKSQIGLYGTVIDDTKNTLLVSTRNGYRRVAKKISRFKFITAKNIFIVDGKEIAFRTYERTQKAYKYYQKRQA